MTIPKKTSLATLAVHAGSQMKQNPFIATAPPIHNSTTYRYNTMEELDAVFENNHRGFCYTRYGNPTVSQFEDAVAHLEGGEAAIAFSSGMAAINCTLTALRAPAECSIVAGQDIYGATRGLLENLRKSERNSVHFVDMTDLKSVVKTCAEVAPKILLFETVSNPLLHIADLRELSRIAKTLNALLVVDNTFASPFLLRPLTLGADVVIHSATKYLGGHGDALGGVLVSSRTLVDACHENNKLVGSSLGPFEAWLLLRGIRTLALRMAAHCDNAMELARWLENHPRVEKVTYPGLPSHKQHGLAKQLFRKDRYGGMVAFEIKNAGKTDIFDFFESLRICIPATTLGDITTSLLYPAHSSHRGLDPGERKRIGISDSLVRVSVGIEGIEDIVNDIDQALKQ